MDDPDPEIANQFPLDPHLGEKLVKWREAFFWMLTEYYTQYKNKGYSEPAAVKLSTLEYKNSNDDYRDFLEQYIEKCPSNIVYSNGEIFDTFVKWFTQNDAQSKPPSRKTFMKYMDAFPGLFCDWAITIWITRLVLNTIVIHCQVQSCVPFH